MRFANFILVGGLLLVGLLVWNKEAVDLDLPATDYQTVLPLSVPTPQLPHEQLESGVRVLRRPVSKEEFATFVQQSNYRSWREQNGLSPTWRDGSANAAVSWMMPSDAEAYCAWLGLRRGGYQFRLPTVAELAQVPECNDWEWSSSTLYDTDPSRAANKAYHTAWHPMQGERHRRPRDLAGSEALATSFRLAWE